MQQLFFVFWVEEGIGSGSGLLEFLISWRPAPAQETLWRRAGARRSFRTRIGKIARLPNKIREELNRRLQGGERGETLLKWLNAQSKVDPTSDSEELAGRMAAVPAEPDYLTEGADR